MFYVALLLGLGLSICPCLPFSSEFKGFVNIIQNKQDEIVRCIESEETARFSDDPFETFTSRGRTRVIQGGRLIEKGAVSTTILEKGRLGEGRAKAISQRQQRGEGRRVSFYFDVYVLLLTAHVCLFLVAMMFLFLMACRRGKVSLSTVAPFTVATSTVAPIYSRARLQSRPSTGSC